MKTNSTGNSMGRVNWLAVNVTTLRPMIWLNRFGLSKFTTYSETMIEEGHYRGKTRGRID
jgi:hypothetical protein